MILKAPDGMASVSVGGTEYKVKDGLAEVPDALGPELFDHGLTVASVAAAPPASKGKQEPPAPPDDKGKQEPPAAGGSKDGK